VIPQEDAVCPHCPQDDPYRLADVGLKIEVETTPDGVTTTFRRPAWELAMMEHLRVKHRSAWRKVVAEMQSWTAQRLSETAARTRDPIAERVSRQTEAGL
jgi:hypothetical protein